MLVGCLQVEIATRMCESVAPSTLKWWQHSRPWPERDEERINSARAEIASNYVDRQTDRRLQSSELAVCEIDPSVCLNSQTRSAATAFQNRYKTSLFASAEKLFSRHWTLLPIKGD